MSEVRATIHAEPALGREDFKWTPAASSAAYPAVEAFLCIVSIAAVIDCAMGALEAARIQFITHRWWASGVLAEKDLPALHAAVTKRLSAPPDQILAAACAALPVQMRAAAFATALDVMLCDGALRPTETAFAEQMAVELDLDQVEVEHIRSVVAALNAY